MAFNQARNEGLAVDFWGLHASEVLGSIERKYGRPSLQELTDFYTTDYIDELVAQRIATSIHLYWDAEYDLSAHAITPRIERIVRALCEDIGFVVYRPPYAGKDGYYLSLGALLHNMLELDAWVMRNTGDVHVLRAERPHGPERSQLPLSRNHACSRTGRRCPSIHVVSLLRRLRKLDCPSGADQSEPD